METRESDHVALYGGEEFAVILTETNVEESKDIAERIRSEIRWMEVVFNNKKISATMSFGIAALFENSKKVTIDDLISQADKAL